MSSEHVTSEHVTIEQRGSVSVITIDDGKANALSADLIAAIDDAISGAEADDATSAAVIAGRPGLLSGGFDLSVMNAGDPAAITNLVADGGALVHHCLGASIPVVAAATGHAVAAGALLLLGCDVRVGADEDSKKIGLPEVAIKMTLPLWAMTIATDRLGRQHLQRALAHGRLTSPAEAVEVGYLDEVAPADEVVNRAIEIATELAETVHLPSYQATNQLLRGEMLDQMAAEAEGMRR